MPKLPDPGPGSYNTLNLHPTTKPTIDQAKRKSIADPPNYNPGPGSYKLQNLIKGPAFSLAGRTKT